ncbi:hypothetical protein GQ43DRAFT_469195 [Delitschia confertaspora ATCC 74209]|uniref:Heterokaryon incompatibility domain-containing protein n=1 Tax=Delitschia confertaspora ATCC 74209 TaxID=1513339 RepID=A0A9P4MSM3_9PLEO|nr:hypothetical protein GQ43DRAFT_469195 [Delitschia confertaspora ATCC 74209]
MQILKVLLPLLALIISTASLPSNPITPPQSLSDPGGPCQSDSNCYGGANCCFSICTLGSCHAPANNAGAACLKDSNCFGGAKCCNSTMKLVTYYDQNIPPYVILSHTWGKDEITFADFVDNLSRSFFKSGSRKINYICRQAEENGYEFIWVDTCCIDKSSSSELSEAINSMYKWYWNTEICYVYLADVTTVEGFIHPTGSLLEPNRNF